MLVGQPVRLLGVWRVCPKLVFSHFPVTMEVWQNTTGAGEGCVISGDLAGKQHQGSLH